MDGTCHEDQAGFKLVAILPPQLSQCFTHIVRDLLAPEAWLEAHGWCSCVWVFQSWSHALAFGFLIWSTRQLVSRVPFYSLLVTEEGEGRQEEERQESQER